MTETQVAEQNQTGQESEVVEEEAQAGKEEAVETATTETDEGLVKDEKNGLSIEDIMSEGEADSKPEEDIVQHGVNKKIGKEVGRRKAAEERATRAEKKIQELEEIGHAPTERPLMPLREDYETGAEYQADVAKYEDQTIAFNSSQNAASGQKARREQARTGDVQRFKDQAVRLRAKYPDFDELVTTDNADGSNPFGSVADLVLSAENNAGLALFLRKNPDKLDALNTMDRNKALLKIGEYSGRFNTVQKKTTNAPQTLNTIKEGSDTKVVSIYDIKDPNEFLRKKNEEILRKRGKPK